MKYPHSLHPGGLHGLNFKATSSSIKKKKIMIFLNQHYPVVRLFFKEYCVQIYVKNLKHKHFTDYMFSEAIDNNK